MIDCSLDRMCLYFMKLSGADSWVFGDFKRVDAETLQSVGGFWPCVLRLTFAEAFAGLLAG